MVALVPSDLMSALPTTLLVVPSELAKVGGWVLEAGSRAGLLTWIRLRRRTRALGGFVTGELVLPALVAPGLGTGGRVALGAVKSAQRRDFTGVAGRGVMEGEDKGVDPGW
jgi:hypothetical protein